MAAGYSLSVMKNAANDLFSAIDFARTLIEEGGERQPMIDTLVEDVVRANQAGDLYDDDRRELLVHIQDLRTV